MRAFLLLLFTLPLAAQAPVGEQAPVPPPPKDAIPLVQQPEATAPATEPFVTGNLDIGYRWVSGVGGDFNTYRSVVNLGDGPRLFNLDAYIVPPSWKFADRITVNASSWGGDPYNVGRVTARKLGVYDFYWNYRNIAYFNFLPSFADPTAETGGIFLNQRGFDTSKRLNDAELVLRPGHRITPYFAFSRSGEHGTGTTNIVFQSNEYTVPDRLDNNVNIYRGGSRFNFNHYNLTLEAGGISYGNDQRVAIGQSPNFGNLTTPFLGQRLFLTDGLQAYNVDGSGVFARGMFAANPVSWADVYGQFQFSQLKTTTTFSENATGNLVDLSTVSFFNGLIRTADSRAKQPHPSAQIGGELRPIRRLRILEFLSTDRLHNTGSEILIDQMLFTGAQPTTETVNAADLLEVSYNQQQVNFLFDVTPRLVVRAGHRYVWGDAKAPAALILGAEGTESAKLRRNVALAGVTWRSPRKLRITAEYEGSPGDRSFFRTSVNEYQKGRVLARYQMLPSLTLTFHFGIFNNENPAPSQYSFQSRDTSLSLYWAPQGGKRVSFIAEYARGTVSSDIDFLVPNTLQPALSTYRERSNTGLLLAEIPLPGRGVFQPKLDFGGSLFHSTGTRPAHYYQPFGRFRLPVYKHVDWYGEWRWYGFTQPTFLYEGFRSNQIVTGLRLYM
jgi:hypothetical protein